MNKYKNAGMTLGFALIIFGLTSLILTLVGIHWYFLGWLEYFGRLFAFVAKIVMVLGGTILFILSRTDWEREREECR
ncbi:MAG: hypothetical protein RIR11_2329 [Bacteroidota bacterium]|jgi:hypothetical protein